MNIEEVDPLKAIRNVGKRLIDFHVADNNRRPPGEGSYDWKKLIETLHEVGYDAYLTQEFVNPVDRTPLGFKNAQNPEKISPDLLKFLQDHGSGVLSATEYDNSVEQAITYLKSLI